MNKALLVLTDGTVFEGRSFGAEGTSEGEVVFNTSMAGYQEILTDPSYAGQMVAMTYPLIGNYGVNEEDFESIRPFLSAFIVKEYSKVHSNYRATSSLGDFLKKHGIIGIEGIDTRMLVRHIREQGSMNGIISTETDDIEDLKKRAAEIEDIVGKDLVKDVTCKEPYEWRQTAWSIDNGYGETDGSRMHIVAVDFGIKQNILRYFAELGCRVTVVPATTTIEEIDALNPDGVFLSNGPGDPEPVTYGIELTKQLIGKYPLFGICLGNQILGLALGGRTYKLKFGHHGGNQPVKDLETGKVEISAQNHCFAVDIDSLGDQVEVTHINLNDKTVEGLRHREHPIFSVQYHPENGPGPHDATYLFERFVKLVESSR
ncbi:glutamine-hydrolyzing carbamoyl-phosphate synthase small subunit [Limisalsivibrio acetivorans]|uniref:glutamine-hydrolyzing carbamoyl-phosphate synthase small subunit n=1 Tax=Limisalsivibrio acetivorans TaxID=1304888 RepID=UPI0003B4B24B|nr:glutamine-hydrolyzing carbamoyl-phosphate synthase small subunit [Limisalsivibrio acetivorans]